MPTDEEYSRAARDMACMLYSDSHIPVVISFVAIYGALRFDGAVPDLYEQECLTMGGPLVHPIDDKHPETDGEGNPEVNARFPRTSAAIGELF